MVASTSSLEVAYSFLQLVARCVSKGLKISMWNLYSISFSYIPWEINSSLPPYDQLDWNLFPSKVGQLTPATSTWNYHVPPHENYINFLCHPCHLHGIHMATIVHLWFLSPQPHLRFPLNSTDLHNAIDSFVYVSRENMSMHTIFNLHKLLDHWIIALHYSIRSWPTI